VRGIVRETHGLVGAEALSRSAPGVSRRVAARIKRSELAACERERKLASRRVTVTHVGAMRGLDEMYVETMSGQRYLLAVSDAAIPFRTSIEGLEQLTADALAQVVDADFRSHGAPLVCRLDRLAAHDAPPMRAVLRDHQVLELHGPPYHSQYYGQQERQNREHRAWLNALAGLDAGDLGAECRRMRAALNGLWRRRTLGWTTSEERWLSRPRLDVDRSALRDEVCARADRLRVERSQAEPYRGYFWRLGIEQALQSRGLLRLDHEGRC
jgi:hypothetical protein